MKYFLITLLVASALLGDDKPKSLAPEVNLQAEYTKALLDLANAQSGRLQMLEQIRKAQADSDDAMAKGQSAVQSVLQKKSAECAAMKPPQQIDQEALQNTGALACKQGSK